MMRLRDVLRVRNETLFQNVEHQVSMATPQLWHSYATFPSGTRHTPEHTQMVERIAGSLLPDALLAELGDDELAFLILACHYHDLGMVGTEEDNLTQESRDRVRREHAVSIGDRIIRHWQTLGFPNETIAAILADICKGHRPTRLNGVATWEDLPEYRIAGPDRDVRVRVVSAIVYAADELHIGEDRAPRREEEFCRIADVEARRHWRRHQAVQGPVLRAGELCFDVRVSTPTIEFELRSALTKAFRSVDELVAQLKLSGLNSLPNRLRVCWDRSGIWELSAASIAADLEARGIERIVDEVESLHLQRAAAFDELATFSRECATATSERDEIRRVVHNLVTREFVVPADEGNVYTLSGAPRSTEYFFGIAKQADEIDSLFVSEDPPQHEHRLYASLFGRRYIREQLHPRLQQDYGINLAAMPSVQYLRETIEASPTAARILQMLSVPPSVLVQTDVLEFASIAGVCADLVNDPELILDSEYRHAVTQLFKAASNRLPKFLLFIEELAIIKKLTVQQVLDAMSPSQEQIEYHRPDAGGITFELNQRFPLARPEWSMGYLMLASRRAEVGISLQSLAAAPFQFKGPSSLGDNLGNSAEDVAAIALDPARPSPPKTGSFRCSLLMDLAEGRLSIVATALTANDTGKPILFQFSPNGAEEAGCTFRVIDTELTVGDVVACEKADEFYRRGKLRTELTIRDELPTLIDTINVAEVLGGFRGEAVRRLADVDATIPFPFYLDREHIDQLSTCRPPDLHRVLETIKSEMASRKLTITTIFLRFSSSEGVDYYEEFLGVQPPSFGFNAPTVKGDEVSQRELNEKWSSGKEEIKIEMSFREDIHHLAKSLRDWVSDVNGEFPFGYDGGLCIHYAQSRVSIVFEKIIDRMWYLERRVIFRFRPITKSERYGTEMMYWEGQGDSSRTELLKELFQAASAEDAVGRS